MFVKPKCSHIRKNAILNKYVTPYTNKNLKINLLSPFLKTMQPVVLKLKSIPSIVASSVEIV